MAKSKLPEELSIAPQVDLSRQFTELARNIALNNDKFSLEEKIDKFKNFKELGAKVNDPINDIPGERGNTALHYLAQSNHADSAKLIQSLVELNCDINIKNQRALTPLHQVIPVNNIEVAETLLKSKADPNAKKTKGEAPLHLLLQLANQSLPNFLSLCKLLIENKANLLQGTDDLDTPVDYLINNLDGIEEKDLKELSKHLLLTPEGEPKNHNTLLTLVINRFIKAELHDKDIILKMLGFLVEGLVAKGEKLLIDTELLNQMELQVNQNNNSQNEILEQLKQTSRVELESDLLTQVLGAEDRSGKDNSASDDNVILSGAGADNPADPSSLAAAESDQVLLGGEQPAGNHIPEDPSLLAGASAENATGACEIM